MNIIASLSTILSEDEGELRGHRPIDSAFIVYRLEEAGATLLALPRSGYSTELRVSHLDVVQEAKEAYGCEAGRIRPAVPSAARITRMDEALGWIALIPRDRYVLRRIVGARSLVSPVTERHLFSWRRLGGVIGADHKAVQRWHAQGIDLLVGALQSAAQVGSPAVTATDERAACSRQSTSLRRSPEDRPAHPSHAPLP